MSKTKNGIGWQVELYTHLFGWQAISNVFTSREEAKQAMLNMPTGFNPQDLRVYEVLS